MTDFSFKPPKILDFKEKIGDNGEQIIWIKYEEDNKWHLISFTKDDNDMTSRTNIEWAFDSF